MAWPRRQGIEAQYTAAADDGLKIALAANIVLFAALLVCRFLLSTAEQPSLGLLLAYASVLLATGCSVAIIAAPLSFWRRLLNLAPIEITVALAGSVVVVAAAALTQAGWDSLSGPTLTLSHWFLTLYEPDVLLNAEQRVLGVGSFKVQVSGACSGIEGVALLAAFLSAYMWVFRRDLRFPNVLLLLPIGLSLIWSLNALRIAVLVSIGAHVSPPSPSRAFTRQRAGSSSCWSRWAA